MRTSILPSCAVLLLPIASWADINPVVLDRWGSRGTAPGQFRYVRAVAVDAWDNVFVVGKNGLQKFTSSGEFLYRRTEGATSAFVDVEGIAVDADGNVYVSDYATKQVHIFDRDGEPTSSFTLDRNPRGLAIDQQGNLYVNDGFIEKYSLDGTRLAEWPAGGADVAVDSEGFVYSGRPSGVFKYTATGEYLGWPAALDRDALYSYAYGITVNQDGFIFVTDGLEYVRVFDAEGRYRDRWQTPSDPLGIAVGSDGSVFVAAWNEIIKYAPLLPSQNPALMLHVGKVTTPRTACEDAPRTGSEIVTTGGALPDGTVSYFVYLLAAPMIRPDDLHNEGLAGVQLGIEYNESLEPGRGIRVHRWVACSDLEFPQEAWPSSGSGNTITWVAPDNCQFEPIIPVGYFFVSAYSPSTMAIAPYPQTGLVKIANCGAAEALPELPLAMAQVGWVSMGGAVLRGDADGCNPLLEPCDGTPVPVRLTTWGRIKAKYGN